MAKELVSLVRDSRTNGGRKPHAPNAFLRNRRGGKGYLAANYGLYLMLIPAALTYLLFRYLPMYGLSMAFQDYNLFTGVFHSKWVGLDVYRDLITQRTFWRVFGNTLRLNLITLFFGFPAPLVFALLLNEVSHSGFKRIVQTISYMPHFISWVIVYGILLTFVSRDTGLLNVLLEKTGHGQVSFLLNHGWWYVLYVGSGLWKEIGFSSILYIAALSSINPELYEAAVVDGAGRFQKLWHITLPGIRGTIVILLIFSIGTMVSIGFEQPFLMGNPVVSDIADVLSTYIYRNGIVQFQFSFTTAIGLFQSVTNLVLLLGANYLAHLLGEHGLFGKEL